MGNYFSADQKEERDLNLVSAGSRAGKGANRNNKELNWANAQSELSKQSTQKYFFKQTGPRGPTFPGITLTILISPKKSEHSNKKNMESTLKIVPFFTKIILPGPTGPTKQSKNYINTIFVYQDLRDLLLNILLRS